MFPIGDIHKSKVREIAENYGLATKNKKDSTGICFIGERNFKNFISNYISFQEGDFKTLDGQVVGKHSGTSFYTIGQRKGLGLGGPGEPWFVASKDIENNVVYVVRGDNHPALYSMELWANELSFVSESDQLELPARVRAKIRYRQKDQWCTIKSIENGVAHVVFEKPQRAVTLRQSIVFYTELDNNDVCLGGGMILKKGETLEASTNTLGH